jgi:uncharacterized protein
MSHTRPVALITGASSGIGEELAKVMARGGFDLVAVARREAELNRLAGELRERHGTTVTVLAVDLASPGAGGDLERRVAATGLEIEVLVNCAGFGGTGAFADSDPDRVMRMLAVNVVALTDLTRRFLPAMTARGSGRVMNVASTAAFQPGPFMAVYYASKAYVLSFTEALAEELSGTGVTATALCPGVVITGFQAASGVDPHSHLVRSAAVKTVEEVAAAGYQAMMRGKRVEIPGTLNKVGVQSLRIAPRRAVVGVVRRLH